VRLTFNQIGGAPAAGRLAPPADREDRSASTPRLRGVASARLSSSATALQRELLWYNRRDGEGTGRLARPHEPGEWRPFPLPLGGDFDPFTKQGVRTESSGGVVMGKSLLVVFAALFFAGTVFAQEVLSNDSVIKLVGSGLSEDMVVNVVKTQPGKYSLAPDDLIALKRAGVSEKVISAMLAKGTGAAESASKDTSAPNLPSDVGVYWKDRGNWAQLLSEPVNWQTGGVLKHMGTMGVVKGDVNGRVYGAHSKTAIPTPVEFLFRLPEGTEITEYQLIHCHGHGGAREFRTVTGGVFHVSGGAKRDLMAFDFKKVADRAFVVELGTLERGEYGFLAPGSAMQSHASAQLGKMYTFHLLE